jgi:hypothetical protein
LLLLLLLLVCGLSMPLNNPHRVVDELREFGRKRRTNAPVAQVGYVVYEGATEFD